MKIVSITPDIDSGGAAKSLFVLAHAIKAAGHDLHVISIAKPSRTKRKVEELRSMGVEVSFFDIPYFPLRLVVCPIPFWVNSWRLLKGLNRFKELARLVKSINPDVVHYNSYTTLLCSLLLGKFPGVLHAREVLVEPSWLTRIVRYIIRARIHAVIGITPEESEQAFRLFQVPTVTIYNWPLESQCCEPMRGGEEIIYGVFSHVTPIKGHLDCVKACALVGNKLRAANVRLRLFGGKVKIHSAYYQAVQDEILNSNLEDLISFPGFSDSPEKEMRRVHLVVRPDRTGQPWGRDVIEAMSLGRPVLAVGSRDYFVKEGQTGVLVPTGNIESLAQALVKLANLEELQMLGEKAYLFARENFNPVKNGARVVEVLEKVAGKGGR